MQAREIRFITQLSPADLIHLGELLTIAKKHGLVMGRVYTQGPGVTVVEIVGVGRTSYDDFIRESEKLGSVRLQSESVHNIEALFLRCRPTPIPYPCTLALLKPHIIRSNKTGDVLLAIAKAGFSVAALLSVHFTVLMAEEMFEAYRGVVPDYSALIEHMSSGPSLALAIYENPGQSDNPYGENIVNRFREFAGPVNPQLAKVLRPSSLRALFGENELENALHCTDLPEDGDMECRYLFETLASLNHK